MDLFPEMKGIPMADLALLKLVSAVRTMRLIENHGDHKMVNRETMIRDHEQRFIAAYDAAKGVKDPSPALKLQLEALQDEFNRILEKNRF
jgi:hypothetical protein